MEASTPLEQLMGASTPLASLPLHNNKCSHLKFTLFSLIVSDTKSQSHPRFNTQSFGWCIQLLTGSR